MKIEEEEEDRISLLPDSLIIELLSRLPLTKDAIRTGVLSKRWQHLWPQNPNLNFTHASTVVDSLFLSGVHKTITRSSQLNLNKFKLEACYNYAFKSEVNSWIRFAVSRKVHSLDITLMGGYHLVSDQSVFINSCFTHLVLKNCILKPSGAISWNKLRSLCITFIVTDKDLIQTILSGSPNLETLELFIPYGYSYSCQIDIYSKSVKKLVLEGYKIYIGASIEINAPNILSLTIRGGFTKRKYLLQNVSSLVEAELDCKMVGYRFGNHEEVAQEEMLKEFILELRHVKKLTIGNQCLKALLRLEAKGFVLPSGVTSCAVTSPCFPDSY